MTVTWKDSPGTVIESADYSGSPNHNSVLTLNDVQSDSLYTCLVKSKVSPGSEESVKTVFLKIYGKNDRIYLFIYLFYFF